VTSLRVSYMMKMQCFFGTTPEERYVCIGEKNLHLEVMGSWDPKKSVPRLRQVVGVGSQREARSHGCAARQHCAI
jgi:hypothetical protein